MSNALDTRLAAAVTTRDRLAADVQRIEGRKEAADAALVKVQEEIREKKLDPDTLDDTIVALKTAYGAAVTQFEVDVESASKAISPYMKDQ